MKVGIIGTGNVGGTLGRRWANNGHSVTFGIRPGREESVRELLAQSGPTAKTGSVAETARDNDVLLLATPWPATEQALIDCESVAGKIVIDATNPLLPDLSGLSLGNGSSGGEMVAQWAPGAKVVKAFNSVGANIMADPGFDAGKVAMFYCGDDAGAKSTVAGLIAELGFEGIDIGPLTQSRSLEYLALLWISLAYKCGFGREIGFQLMRRGNKT